MGLGFFRNLKKALVLRRLQRNRLEGYRAPSQKIANLISSFFCIGYIPGCPGTAASLATLLIVFSTPLLPVGYSLGIALALTAIGLLAVKRSLPNSVNQDPSWIVIDEVVGMLIALIAVPQQWGWYFLAFAVFRLLDIFKPFPIGFIDRRLPGCWGVLGDDIVAGVITRLLLWLVAVFIAWFTCV